MGFNSFFRLFFPPLLPLLLELTTALALLIACCFIDSLLPFMLCYRREVVSAKYMSRASSRETVGQVFHSEAVSFANAAARSAIGGRRAREVHRIGRRQYLRCPTATLLVFLLQIVTQIARGTEMCLNVKSHRTVQGWLCELCATHAALQSESG